MDLKTVNDVVAFISGQKIEDSDDVADAFLANKVDGVFLRNMYFQLQKNESNFYDMLRNRFDIYDPFVLRHLAELIRAWYLYDQKRLQEKEIREENESKIQERICFDDNDDDNNVVIAVVDEKIITTASGMTDFKANSNKIFMTVPLTQKMAEELKIYAKTLTMDDFDDSEKRSNIRLHLRKTLHRTFDIKDSKFLKRDGFFKIQLYCRCVKCKNYNKTVDFPTIPLIINIIFKENESFGQLVNMNEVTKFICSK